jgi:CHAT domain/SIR2-like domain
MPDEYLDFEVYIGNFDQAVAKLGDVPYPWRPSLGEETRRALLEVSSDDMEYGKLLFGALYPSDSNGITGYRNALAQIGSDKRLRYRLNIDVNAPPELHNLNWELLYDPIKERFLSCSPDTAFSRCLSVTEAPPPMLEGQPKLLIVISSPTDLPKYNLDNIDRQDTRTKIEQALLPLDGFMQYEFFDGVATPPAIRDRLVEGSFQALHIQGHGRFNDSVGELVLEKPDGTCAFVDESVFSLMFDGLRNLRLIAIVACHSGVQGDEDLFSGLASSVVKRGFAAVLAMRQSITIEAAMAFMKAFYQNLARTGMVDAATNEARNQLLLDTEGVRIEWSTPALFMRLKEGKLWDRQTPQPSAAVPTDRQAIIGSIKMSLPGGKVIPILGPGLNDDLLITNGKLTDTWMAQYNYPAKGRNDLPRVANFVETMWGLRVPHQELFRLQKEHLLKNFKEEERNVMNSFSLQQVITKFAPTLFRDDPNNPYLMLARLNVSTYITTTGDNFLLEALKWVNKDAQVVSFPWRLNDRPTSQYEDIKGSLEKPLILHLYGQDEDSVVLTEDEFLEFLRAVSKHEWRIPTHVLGDLTKSMLLFLGFNTRDLDFRVFFKGIVGQLSEQLRDRIAVIQVSPGASPKQRREEKRQLETFLANDCSRLSIKLLRESVRDFLAGL